MKQKSNKISISKPTPDYDIEKFALSCCILKRSALGLYADGFQHPKYQGIFYAIEALEREGRQATPVAIWRKCKELGHDIHVHDIADTEFYATDILSKMDPNYVQDVIAAFLEYYKRQLIFKSLTQPLDDIENIDLNKAIKDIESRLEFIKAIDIQTRAFSLKDLGENLISGEFKISFLSSGIPVFDHQVGGWIPGGLHVIMARPGIGKTSLALSFIRASMTKYHHLLFSYEMTKEEIVARFLVMQTGLPFKQVFTAGKQDQHIQEQLKSALQNFERSKLIIIDDNTLDLAKIEAAIQKNRPQIVWFDYLQLLRGAVQARNREEEVAQYSTFFKGIAKKYRIPVIILCQLNRASEKENRRPRISDLRESGTIEQAADLIIGIHHKESFVEQRREVFIAKGRNIPLGNINLTWDGPRMLFYEEAHV